MPSLLSAVLVAYLRATRRKRPFTDPRFLHRLIAAERVTVDPSPPRALASRLDVTEHRVGEMRAFTLSPRAVDTGRRILFLHGGCYVFDITPYHWRFCAALAQNLGAKVTVPLYPLAPEHGVVDVLAPVAAAYRALASDPAKTAIIGDSAGGGMALALAAQLRAEGAAQPRDIVLLSPWVDATMENPAIAAIDAIDPWLSPAGLVEAGRLYAKDLDPKDPRVSPIYGDVEGLGALSIFIGTRDVLLPDARRLCERAKEAGTSARLIEYPGMVHDFMLVDFLPEARQALAAIEAVLRGDASN